MSDILYAGPAACPDGRAWFAANSLRSSAEAVALCLVEARPPEDFTAVGERVFPAKDPGYAFALTKPFQSEGGESGLNEAGVAIGLVYLRSRFRPSTQGYFGAELLRAALASSAGAREALDFMTAWVETNEQAGRGPGRGQAGDCGYIVAGPDSAYILETAGRRWAWREVEGLAALSAAYSIEEDYKRLDVQSRKEISPVNERAACSDEADPGRKGHKESWRGHVERRSFLSPVPRDIRRAAALSTLEGARGRISLGTVLGALRAHNGYDPGRPWLRAGEGSCVHGGGHARRLATTASLAVEYLPHAGEGGTRALLWFTGSSCPCLSVYKPILLSGGRFEPLWGGYDYDEDAAAAYAHWERHRAWMARDRGGRLARDGDFAARRDGIQARLVEAAATAAAGGPPEAARAEIDAALASWHEGLVGW